MDELTICALGALGASRPAAFATGPFGSAVSAKNFQKSGIPMLRGGNLSDDIGVRLNESEVVHVSENLANKYRRSIAVRGDLVFTCWGTIGQVGLIDRRSKHERYLVSNKQMKMSPDSARVLPLYLYYYLSQPQVVDLIRSRSIGSSVPGFNLGQLKDLQVRLPSIRTQGGIAEILGALDDKIAANDHTRDLCLALADFEFSRTVKNVRLADKTFGDLADVAGGSTPKTSVEDFWNGDVPWATPTDLTGLSGPYLRRTSRMITNHGLISCSSSLYPKGSILMTSRATIGAFALAEVPTAVNQGFIVVNAKDPIHQLWLFHEMRSRVSEFVSHANGATFLELSRGKFKKFHVRMPSDDQLLSFSLSVRPLHELASQTMAETEVLARTRDALLPLLMSGKVRVRDAEKVVEEVV